MGFPCWTETEQLTNITQVDKFKPNQPPLELVIEDDKFRNFLPFHYTKFQRIYLILSQKQLLYTPGFYIHP